MKNATTYTTRSVRSPSKAARPKETRVGRWEKELWVEPLKSPGRSDDAAAVVNTPLACTIIVLAE